MRIRHVHSLLYLFFRNINAARYLFGIINKQKCLNFKKFSDSQLKTSMEVHGICIPLIPSITKDGILMVLPSKLPLALIQKHLPLTNYTSPSQKDGDSFMIFQLPARDGLLMDHVSVPTGINRNILALFSDIIKSCPTVDGTSSTQHHAPQRAGLDLDGV
jgi:hypothetical protein